MTLTSGFSQTRPSLNDSITTYLRTLPVSATVSLAVQSLTDSNVAVFVNADKSVPSASVIKLPIMVEAMERAKAGTLDLSEIHILTDSEKTGGDGVLKNYSHRSRISYADLLRLMMVYSDNTATNIFINELGMDAINARIKALGLTGTHLNRVMMDTLATRQGRDNYVTARDMNRLLSQTYRHQLATPALCDQMLDILKQNEDTLTISRLLPKTIFVAHKTGTLAYIRGDAGIVYAPKPFALTVLVQGVPTPDAERIIAELALVCYRWFDKQ
ncbi:serine hydrolase [Spirosoma rhododendri]|uniref:beta-lactamase n=1 Tax=Spirosoma rhododendri TaxID=2728024 RepID=A0A7L5DTM0_9BACT|nr:serine hydrolase [Spirosoma rhododendri]QJD80962.1 serine hydrolase [Spirosoma rhododendri]